MKSNNILSYGIKEKNTALNALDYHVENIISKGYTVVEDALSRDELELYRTKLDSVYTLQVDEIGGSDNLKKINDENIVRLPLAYDKKFLDLVINSKVVEIVESVLGDFFILMLQNGIINVPSDINYQASWHRDLNYQHFTSSRPLAISALYCIDDFTEETGGTYFLPYSQKVEKFFTEKYILENEITIPVKAGGVILFDSMIFHRAGHNKSKNIRRGINHMYTLPFIKQQIDIPSALGQSNAPNDDFLKKLLGYTSASGKNVKEWRQRRIH